MQPPSLTACHQWPVTHARFPNGGMRTSSNQKWFQSSSFSCQLTFIFAKKNSFCQDLQFWDLVFSSRFPLFPHPPHHITSQKSGLKRPRYHSSTHTTASWLVVSNVQRSNQHDPADSYCESPRTLGDRPGGSLACCRRGMLISWLIIIPTKLEPIQPGFFSLLKMLRMLGFLIRVQWFVHT